MKDLYKTLGVPESADDAAVKKAYRKLAKEFHPDVTGGDKKKTERFKEINEAYAVLGDKEKRAEYERLRHAPVRPDGMPEWFDAEAFARTSAGGRGSFSPSSVSTTQLPRSTGLVRDAPDCFACTLANPSTPPRPYFFTPSTRRHCGPVTPGMP